MQHSPAVAADAHSTTSPPSGCRVLFVDLDGTLINSDILLESILLAARRQPAALLSALGWSFRSRAMMKRILAQRVMPDVGHLPFRDDVLKFLEHQKSQGVRIVLATASDRIWADAVSRQLGLFDDVLASDGQLNLKGSAKLAAIRTYCQNAGFPTFCYLADSHADLPIWKCAAEIGVVEPDGRLLKQLQGCGGTVQTFGQPTRRWRSALRALRPQQWVKNVLLFAPLLLAHQLANVEKLVAAFLCFAAFSAVASATYVLNDLLDLSSDRVHPDKCRRAFASGALPLAWGPPLAAGLLVFGIGLSLAALPWAFTGLLALYLVLTILYSFWLKRKVMIDVLLLAGLYTLRILAGGVGTDIPVSEWLMAFSLFLFTSLAFGKRYIELSKLTDDTAADARGRGYMVSDLSLLESVGPTNGYLAVLVLALYIHSDAAKLYPHAWALWLICPLMLYWISRFWILAKRQVLSDDPIVFAIKDRISRGLGVVALLLASFAAWRG